MRTTMKRLVRTAAVCVASLVSAGLFCFGCSTHEMNRYGQPEDIITFLLAGGTYLSLAVCIGAVILCITSVRDSN